jgi:type I restriction enzyme S subunit
MQEKASVPAIRFAGFTDAWEQRKLGDAFDMTISNNTLSRAELNYDSGEVQNIHYGDVLIKYGAFIDAQFDEIPFITEGKAEQYKAQLLQDGDIIFADTAEDETTGKAAEIGHLMEKPVVSGLHTIVCRPYEKKAKYYLGYYLNSESYHRQLLPLMQGIKVLSLSRANLSNTVIQYPVSESEQAQIGNFFCQLDHLITLQQRKIEELKRQKKALMQLLLTGIVRVDV